MAPVKTLARASTPSPFSKGTSVGAPTTPLEFKALQALAIPIAPASPSSNVGTRIRTSMRTSRSTTTWRGHRPFRRLRQQQESVTSSFPTHIYTFAASTAQLSRLFASSLCPLVLHLPHRSPNYYSQAVVALDTVTVRDTVTNGPSPLVSVSLSVVRSLREPRSPLDPLATGS